MSHFKNNYDKRRKEHFERDKRKRERTSHLNRVASVARKQANITGSQKLAMELLDKARIIYVYEKPIQHFKSFFLIDIYLPETKICIEIDGSSHDLPEKQQSDLIRDNFLKAQGYWVFRIKNWEVRESFLPKIRSIIGIRRYWIEKKRKKTCKDEKKE
jgi:very-short-patch-repair endonuclease